MKDTVKDYLDKKKKRASRQKKVVATLLSLSLVVATGVTWSLHQTGESLAGETYCGKVEHTHTDACLKKETEQTDTKAAETEKVLTCTLPEHTHTDACIQKTLICGMEEGQGAHTHTADCYQEQKTLTCTLAEHVHGEGCYDADGNLICEIPEHTHGEECYTTEQVLVCGQEESAGHVHTDACYEITYTCGMEEHTHTDACYSTAEVTEGANEAATESASADGTKKPEYTCGLEEHKHTLQCYSNPNADLESAAVWEQTIAGVQLTGDYGKDVVAIAKTQLGYHESTANYNVVKGDDGTEKMKGYTRYGAWYGSPYEDWCAMFASFCISYAHVDYPLEASCPNWINTLSYKGEYVSRDSWTPAIGDLVFFDQNGDGTSDHVGIVEALTQNGSVLGDDADLTVADGIKTIEGNTSDQVAERSYSRSDSTIMGYGVLPVKEEKETSDPNADVETAEVWEATLSGVTLTGDARKDLIAVAETQIGYQESTKNYETVQKEDGTEVKKGYTRYGAWYGNSYEDWCAMFTSFCLHYANIDYPTNAACQSWIDALTADGKYTAKDTWTPAAGDLVFFDQNGDGTADHVGIVAALTQDGTDLDEDADVTTANSIRTIEGDVHDQVAEQSYALSDGTIVGYGVLVAEQKEEAATYTKTAECEGYKVTVTYGEDAQIPEEAELVVEKDDDETDQNALNQAVAEAEGLNDQGNGEESNTGKTEEELPIDDSSEEWNTVLDKEGSLEVKSLFRLRISFVLNGEEIEPAEGSKVDVEVSLPDDLKMEENAQIGIAHYKTDGETEIIGEVEKTGTEKSHTTLSFSMNSFSVIEPYEAKIAEGGDNYLTALDGGSEGTTTLSPAYSKYIKYNGDDTYDLTLNVVGATASETNKAKVDIVFVVDVSGSMDDDNKLKNVKTGIQNVVNQLSDSTTDVGKKIDAQYKLVTFAANAQIITNNWVDGSTVVSDVNQLTANGGTNYHDGLLKAGEAASNKSSSDAQTVVLFLTDGMPQRCLMKKVDRSTYNSTAENGRISLNSGYYIVSNDGSSTNLRNNLGVNVDTNEDRYGLYYYGALMGADTISCDKFYAVGYGVSNTTDSDIWSGVNPRTPLQLLQNVANATHASTKSAQVIGTNGLTEFLDSFSASITNIEVTNVTIADTLSDYAEVNGDDAKVTITVTDADGNVQGTQSGTISNLPTLTLQDGGSYTLSAAYENKQLKLDFSDNYKLHQDWTYSITVQIKPTEEAYSTFASSGYNSTGAENTDAPNNDTSSGKSGFHSNSTATLDYTVTGQSPSQKGYPHPVIQVTPKADLQVLKIDSTSTSDNVIRVENAKFVLYQTNSENVNLYYRSADNTFSALGTKTDGTQEAENDVALTTPSTGVINFEKLTDGTYYLKEIAAPDAYETPSGDDAITTITVTRGVPKIGDTALTADDGKYVVTKTNTKKTAYADLVLTKVDGSNNNVALAGAEFTLTKTENGKTYYYTGETDDVATWTEEETDGKAPSGAAKAVGSDGINKGKLTFTGLTQGEYTLTETKAPDGYNLLSNTITVTVAENGKVTLTGTGSSSQGSIEVTSTELDGQRYGYSNTFSVSNYSGEKLQMTGGPGTTMLTLSGLLLMTASLVYGCGLRRRRERRAR